MKKRCLIGFVGLPRTYEICYPILYKKVILPNMDHFDFVYIVNTDSSNKQTIYSQRWSEVDKTYHTSYYPDNLHNDLCNTYGPNLYNITFDELLATNNVQSGFSLFHQRIKNILTYCEVNNIHEQFDLYLFIRMDTIILCNHINLTNYLDTKATIIPSHFCDEVTQLRDLDYCLIGNFLSLKQYLYPNKNKNKEFQIDESVYSHIIRFHNDWEWKKNRYNIEFQTEF